MLCGTKQFPTLTGLDSGRSREGDNGGLPVYYIASWGKTRSWPVLYRPSFGQLKDPPPVALYEDFWKVRPELYLRRLLRHSPSRPLSTDRRQRVYPSPVTRRLGYVGWLLERSEPPCLLAPAPRSKIVLCADHVAEHLEDGTHRVSALVRAVIDDE
jgi:hypothetical protein